MFFFLHNLLRSIEDRNHERYVHVNVTDPVVLTGQVFHFRSKLQIHEKIVIPTQHRHRQVLVLVLVLVLVVVVVLVILVLVLVVVETVV